MKKSNKSKIQQAQDFIEKNYKIRYNVVSNRFEYLKLHKEPKEWTDLNENDVLIDLLKNHYQISQNILIALLKSDFVEKYNPLKDYFENLPKWNGKTDYIKKLSEYIRIKPEDKERFERNFKKMFLRSIASSLEIALNKQAFIIVHNKQNSGKSTFLRWLCPPKLQPYYTEEIGLDKDSLIALAENFIINLDELSTLSKKDINELKSVMSKDAIKVRLPYDKRTSVLKRRCNFVGSTNETEFLSDATGNVRWVCFEIEKINWNYNKDFDINKVWSQAYTMFKKGAEYQLTKAEIKENEIANKSFLIRTPEMELLQLYYAPSDEYNSNAVFMTSTEITKAINEKTFSTVRIYPNRIGKALSILGYQKSSRYDKELKFTVKGYYLIPKNEATSMYSTENDIEAAENILKEQS